MSTPMEGVVMLFILLAYAGGFYAGYQYRKTLEDNRG